MTYQLYICNGVGKDFCEPNQCVHSEPHVRSCIDCGADDEGVCCCSAYPNDFCTEEGDCDGNDNMIRCILWKSDYFISDEEIMIK